MPLKLWFELLLLLLGRFQIYVIFEHFHCDIRSNVNPHPCITKRLSARGMVHTTFLSFSTIWHNYLASSIMLGLRPNLYFFWSSVLVRSSQIQSNINVTELLEWGALWFLDQVGCSRQTNSILQLASETAPVSVITCLLHQLPHPLRYCSKYTQMPRGPSFLILAIPSINLPFSLPFS